MLSVILALLLQLPAPAGMIPAKLTTAVPPNPPPNAVEGTCVLADVPVDRQGRVGAVKILQGLGPFHESATAAIQQWRFSPAVSKGEAMASRVGVLTVFRPAAMGNVGLGGPTFGYKAPTAIGNTHPPYPRTIEDPGYPQNTTGAGVVIIEVIVDKNGIPSNMRTVQDVPPLTDLARGSIRSWSFMPAMESGQPVNGTLIVAISFMRPVSAN